MADNYLENKFEEYRTGTVRKARPSGTQLDSLLSRNRSFRGYDTSYTVKRAQLERIVGVNMKVASARNQQVLRFKLLTKENGSQRMGGLIKLGAALPELHLPFPGSEPEAFIIVCSTIPENKFVDIDLGISLQSMLLKAVDMSLSGIIVCAFNKEKVKEEFNLPFDPLAILAIGKGNEKIETIPIKENECHAYYRSNGIHYVPKVVLEDLLIP